MRLARAYTAVEVHAEGEQGTCYLGSVFEVPGLTAREKLHHLNAPEPQLAGERERESGFEAVLRAST